MPHFTVTRDVIRRISEIETPHACALNEDITDEFPTTRARLTRSPWGSALPPCWVRFAMLPSGRTRSLP